MDLTKSHIRFDYLNGTEFDNDKKSSSRQVSIIHNMVDTAMMPTISGFRVPNKTLATDMAPSVSLKLISLVTFCVGLREEPQTAHPMSFTWAFHIATSVLMGR